MCFFNGYFKEDHLFSRFRKKICQCTHNRLDRLIYIVVLNSHDEMVETTFFTPDSKIEEVILQCSHRVILKQSAGLVLYAKVRHTC